MEKVNNVMVMATVKGQMFCTRIKEKLSEQKGDFASDKGIVIAITVALGGVALVLAIALFKDTIGPTLQSKITEFFNMK